MQALALREASNSPETIEVRFLDVRVLPRKALNCNLFLKFGRFSLKRALSNANARRMQMLAF